MSEHPRFDLTDALPRGRVAIEASAGTGKTYTLAGLAVRYIAEGAVPTSELLVVTFTRAAAAELRDRIRSRLAEALRFLRRDATEVTEDEVLAHLAQRDRSSRADRVEAAISDFDAATITTIHGFAQQVLTTLGSAAPGDLDANLVDDAHELVTEVCADLLAAAAVMEPDVVGELPTYKQLAPLVLAVLRNPGIALVPGPDPDESSAAGARWRRLVDRSVDEVHRRRRDSGTMSFDDVLTQLRDALRQSPAAAAGLRRRYRVALIDEFQDTDPVQWQIFSTLFDRPDGSPDRERALVLVGDPKQAIYAFRGANVHTYLDAAYEPGTERSTLGTNWRSDQALLASLKVLLSGATFGDPRIGFVDITAAPEHVDRRVQTTSGVALPALQVRAALAPDLDRTNAKPDSPIRTPVADRAIGRDLARQVQLLLEDAWLPVGQGPESRRRVQPRDVAVLVGTHSEASLMQAALVRQGIPAVAHRGGSVLESAAATQWRWLLGGLARPSDAARARTAALSWFFDWTVETLDTASDDELAGVQETLYRWAAVLDAHGAVGFCSHVWSESGVMNRVLATPEGDRNLTDLDHLAQLLQASASGHRPGPVGLLAALKLLEEAHELDPEYELIARRIESEAEAVQVMTVYAAKGLEFPVVCVPTLWRKSAATSTERIYQDPGTGVRTFDLVKDDKWPTKIAATERKRLAAFEAIGGNLRLLYVALTRAQHQTIVWWTHAEGSDITGLARLLFARDELGRPDPELFAEDKVPLPADAEAIATLEPVFAPVGDMVTLTETGLAAEPHARWQPTDRPASPPVLELAGLGRSLDRPNRRWSFSMISDRAGDVDFDLEASPDDAGATDEPTVDGDAQGLEDTLAAAGVGVTGGAAVEPTSDLPLGTLAGGTGFGTMVHDLLEHVDFAAPDLDAALQDSIDDHRRWNRSPVLGDVLHAGLRAAIETPLGPLFDGRRLCDLSRADRLDELSFELRLGEGGRHATDRDIGALMVHHLAGDDPLRPWAERLAAGLFDVELAGHLTGSIDAVFRLHSITSLIAPPRYVLADYKTNLLAERGCLAQSADYRPDRLPAAMEEHHYPLQALLYSVALHRYLRWRVLDYDPEVHFGGAAYLFLRGMIGADTPVVDGHPHGVFGWRVPPALVVDLSDLLDGQLVTT